MLELNLFEMMPLGCSFPGVTGFHFWLVMRTAVPIGFFIVALTVRWLVTRKRKPGDPENFSSWLGERLLSACFFLLFLLYPSNSQKLFSATFCIEVDGEDGFRKFLRADLAVNCERATHAFFASVYALLSLLRTASPCAA